ncbi:hypothetical protein [Pseudonocardia nigra]|uniref:hypothetical protein n=1 Tax=Pseudonocardia nigra TaxID=1921578 RepID=UPI001C5DDC98|nr:hypothetical protein [Pseudonocardia nigra]
MTAEVVTMSREDLQQRRRELLARIPDERVLRQRAREHAITPDERDVLIELEEVDFLLGDDG